MAELLCCITLDFTGRPNLDTECIFSTHIQVCFVCGVYRVIILQCSVEIQCVCEHDLCSMLLHFPSIPNKNKKIIHNNKKNILADNITSSIQRCFILFLPIWENLQCILAWASVQLSYFLHQCNSQDLSSNHVVFLIISIQFKSRNFICL